MLILFRKILMFGLMNMSKELGISQIFIDYHYFSNTKAIINISLLIKRIILSILTIIFLVLWLGIT